MRTMTSRCAVLCAVVLLAGCTAEQSEPVKAEAEPFAAQPLTAEEARDALVTMLQRPDADDLHSPFLLRQLNNPIKQEADKVTIGSCWTCNLDRKRFRASVISYRGGNDRARCEYEGIFERQADGRWLAKLTKSSEIW